MANAFSKEEIVFFDDVLAGFDPNNITAKQSTKFKPPSMGYERSALTVWRPTPYITLGTDGLVLTDADFADRTQLSVPSTLNANDSAPSDIKNIPWKMNAIELNDPLQRDRIAKGAIQKLSAKVDELTATEVALRGSLFIKDAAPITTYSQVSQAELQMSVRDVPIDDSRTLIMNPADYNGCAGDLAKRDAPPTGVSLTAYERSKIPTIATFDSFKANFMPTQQISAGSGYLINGVDQSHHPLATDANGQNVDNRTQSLIVDTGAGILKKGDAFTIAGVFAVSHIHKNVTSYLQTFRVYADAAGAGAQTITITPAIVVSGSAGSTQADTDYANCSAVPANNAVITMLNTGAAQPSNVFWKNDSVEIVHGSLATMDLNKGGVDTLMGSTDSGIELVLARQSSILNMGTKYRFIMWMRPNVLIPEMCGNLVGTG